MNHEYKASSVMSNPLNKIIYFFDRSHITEQIIDHYTDALEVYKANKDQQKITEMRKKLISLYLTINNSISKYYVNMYSLELGDDFLKINNVHEAQVHYTRAINTCTGDFDKLVRTYEHISDSYYESKKYRIAYEFYEEYLKLKVDPLSKILSNFAVCCIKEGKYLKASDILSKEIIECKNNKTLSQLTNININELRCKYIFEKYYLQSVLCCLLVDPSTARIKLNELVQLNKITNNQKIENIKLIINNYEISKFNLCIKNLKILMITDDIITSITECLNEKKIKYNANKIPKTLGDILISNSNSNNNIDGLLKSKVNEYKNALLKDVKLPNGGAKNSSQDLDKATQGDILVKAFYTDAGEVDLC